jgi:hypothetical protein
MKMMLKQNMGKLDRVLRISIGSLLLFFALFIAQGSTATLLAIISVPPLLTGISGICILYVPFGFSTKSQRKEDSPWKTGLEV